MKDKNKIKEIIYDPIKKRLTIIFYDGRKIGFIGDIAVEKYNSLSHE